MKTNTKTTTPAPKKAAPTPPPVVKAAVKEAPKIATEGKKLVGMRKKGASEEQQKWIAYAFARCGETCVYTWEGESGWVQFAKNTANKNGTYDAGLCQFNSRYHGAFIKSPDFQDPYKQLDRCVGIWHDAVKRGRLKTTFYAYNVINKRPGVKDRFDLIFE